MGMLGDIAMPIGLTFAARPYEDTKLLCYAYAFEQSTRWRRMPPRTPPLPSDLFPANATIASNARPNAGVGYGFKATAIDRPDGMVEISIEGESTALRVRLFINGAPVAVTRDGITFTARHSLPAKAKRPRHSEWRAPYGHLVLMIADGGAALPDASFLVVDGVE
jgi:amidase